MTEWVKKLASTAASSEANEIAGLRLLGFFEDMAVTEDGVVPTGCVGEKGEGGVKNGDLVFETEKTREISRALRECGPFCGEWMEGNVRAWRESGFLMN